MTNLKNEILDSVEKYMVDDCDVANQTDRVVAITNTLLDNVEYKKIEGSDSDSLNFIRTAIIFLNSVGGSQADYCANNVLKALKHIEITKVNEDYMDKIVEEIEESAINSDWELSFLAPFRK